MFTFKFLTKYIRLFFTKVGSVDSDIAQDLGTKSLTDVNIIPVCMCVSGLNWN